MKSPVLLALFLLLGCDGPGPAPQPAAAETVPAAPEAPAAPADAPEAPGPRARLSREEVPKATRPCFFCHRSIVESYARHGMSESLGPAGTPAPGVVANPSSGNTYELSSGPDGAWLTTTTADGGVRRQRVVGRIGAGVDDTSWATMEVDALTGEETGRLFFGPVETITGHGLELSPFEVTEPMAGPDFALEEGCLTCHTDSRLDLLPGAREASAGGRSRNLMPSNALGADAFEHLEPLGCEACHGDTARHLELMPPISGDDDLGLPRLGRLEPAAQRDVCARCHLQGDVRLDLVREPPRLDLPLAGQVPVLVPRRAVADHRFVSQLERLALSACFRATPEMTCTTCHDPHQSAAGQGVASFEDACRACHETDGASHCSRPAELEPGDGGCIGCHVRRSQPFDLPHVQNADHFVRRRIPDSAEDVPYRQLADPGGELVVYDDGRLQDAWTTPAGVRWRSGVLAMGLVTLGRLEEAARLFAAFPPPGSEAARTPEGPPSLVPLQTNAAFHQLRALSFLAQGRSEEAKAAFGDALILDPLEPSALLGRARLRFMTGDVEGALRDTQTVIDNYPEAEQPWDLRLEMAERLGRPDLATAALRASTSRWPSNPLSWYKLGLLLRQEGSEDPARDALARARILKPSLFD